ncbi:MAG: hypothetical protein WCO04_04095 [Pseudomonadota bacterium]
MGRRNASNADVETAAQARAFIVGLPGGHDAQVGENGILLLDEATSALDNRAAWHVRDAVSTGTRGRTTSWIVHRLSTILAADEVAYIDGDRLVEQGPIAEMLNGKGKVAALFETLTVKNHTA